jgi:hypothetical protein
MPRVLALEVQASVRFVLELLCTFADKDGLCWMSPRELAAMLARSERCKRYKLPTVLKALRQLRTMGLVSWVVVRAWGRFPGRDPLTKRAVENEGRFTTSGGRVWRVNLAKLGLLPMPARKLPRAGTGSVGAILQDRPRTILQDRPSDPLISSGDLKITDPAPLDRGAARPSAAVETIDGPEGPACDAGPIAIGNAIARTSVAAARAPAAPPALPETSRAASAAGASPLGSAEIERQRGGVGLPDAEREAVDAAARAEIAHYWAAIRALPGQRRS